MYTVFCTDSFRYSVLLTSTLHLAICNWVFCDKFIYFFTLIDWSDNNFELGIKKNPRFFCTGIVILLLGT